MACGNTRQEGNYGGETYVNPRAEEKQRSAGRRKKRGKTFVKKRRVVPEHLSYGAPNLLGDSYCAWFSTAASPKINRGRAVKKK